MTVALAHQVSSSSKTIALHEAAREAKLRDADLAVLHVVETLDLDVQDAYRNSLGDEIESALADVDATGVPWQLHLATAPHDDVAEAILSLTQTAKAGLLVIGARRRSPAGKFLLGSVTQSLILAADVPVLVVKSSS
jgi:nucleotide-binding universal stress UspA family protein